MDVEVGYSYVWGGATRHGTVPLLGLSWCLRCNKALFLMLLYRSRALLSIVSVFSFFLPSNQGTELVASCIDKVKYFEVYKCTLLA